MATRPWKRVGFKFKDIRLWIKLTTSGPKTCYKWMNTSPPFNTDMGRMARWSKTLRPNTAIELSAVSSTMFFLMNMPDHQVPQMIKLIPYELTCHKFQQKYVEMLLKSILASMDAMTMYIALLDWSIAHERRQIFAMNWNVTGTGQWSSSGPKPFYTGFFIFLFNRIHPKQGSNHIRTQEITCKN